LPPTEFPPTLRSYLDREREGVQLPSPEDLCDGAEWLARALARGGNLLRFGIAAMLFYLTVEIGAAFLPGGAVERVLGGLR
jgi:hypothetical protein